MKRIMLSLLMLSCYLTATDKIEHVSSYQACEYILENSKLENTAERAVYLYLKTLKDKKKAIAIAEELLKKGLLSCIYVDQLKKTVN